MKSHKAEDRDSGGLSSGLQGKTEVKWMYAQRCEHTPSQKSTEIKGGKNEFVDPVQGWGCPGSWQSETPPVRKLHSNKHGLTPSSETDFHKSNKKGCLIMFLRDRSFSAAGRTPNQIVVHFSHVTISAAEVVGWTAQWHQGLESASEMHSAFLSQLGEGCSSIR